MYERDDAPAERGGDDEAPPIADNDGSDHEGSDQSDHEDDDHDGSGHEEASDHEGSDHGGGEASDFDDASTIRLDDAREEVAEGDDAAGGDNVAEGDTDSEAEASDEGSYGAKSPPHFSSDEEEEKKENMPAGSNGDAREPAACWRFGAGKMCDGRDCLPCREALVTPKRRRIDEPIEEPKSEPKVERFPSTRLERRASDGKLAACL